MKAPVYLYTGPEFGQRNEAVDQIKSSLQKKYGEVDNHLFYLVETSFSQVMTILSSGTLFSNAVCVVCKNAELLKKKEELQILSEWMENPGESSVLILVSDEITVDAKLEKLVPSENRKKFWEMFDSDKLPWVVNYFKQNGYTIESSAASLILELIENNTQALKNECSRFFICFPKEHVISEEDVESILSHTREESPFTLFNQIAQPSDAPQKRLEKGLEILQKIRLSKENNSVSLIAGLSSCFRKLVLWHEICPNGYEADDFTCKTNGFSSKIMRKQYKNAAKIWTTGQATAILAVLASTDMEIRSGGAALEDVMLQKMLYEIILKRGAPIAQAVIQD